MLSGEENTRPGGAVWDGEPQAAPRALQMELPWSGSSRELEAVIKRAENDAFAIGYAHGYSNGMHGRVIPDHVPKHAGDCCSLLFVSDVELSDFVDDVRVLNAFRRAGLMTIGDVALHYDEHGGLGGNWSMGVKCINWMNKALSELYGVTLPASQNVIRALRDAREAQAKLPDMM